MSKVSEPLVSVVTPVYNGERFLAACIESVLSQSHSNLEYVILDNASTDGSRKIINRYANCDSRIRVIRNSQLLPQIDNWNESMRHMGEDSIYCKVIHADDLLLPECIERMVDIGEQYPSVSLIGAYRIDGRGIGMTGIEYPTEFVKGRELARARLLGRIPDVFGSPTSVMYRSSAVRARGDDFYNRHNPHADTEACFALLQDGDYGFVQQILTFTRRHAGAETLAMRAQGTHNIGRIRIARDLGPAFLNAQEHRQAMDLQLRYYYGYLASNLRRLADSGFRQETDALFASCDSRLRLSKLSISAARSWYRGAAERLGRLFRAI